MPKDHHLLLPILPNFLLDDALVGVLAATTAFPLPAGLCLPETRLLLLLLPLGVCRTISLLVRVLLIIYLDKLCLCACPCTKLQQDLIVSFLVRIRRTSSCHGDATTAKRNSIPHPADRK